jgi:hypothetical protein
LAIGEVARASEQLLAEATRPKQRIEVLEEDNRRLSAANEAMRREAGSFLTAARK